MLLNLTQAPCLSKDVNQSRLVSSPSSMLEVDNLQSTTTVPQSTSTTVPHSLSTGTTAISKSKSPGPGSATKKPDCHRSRKGVSGASQQRSSFPVAKLQSSGSQPREISRSPTAG